MREKERGARCFMGYHRTEPPPAYGLSLRRETARSLYLLLLLPSTHPFTLLVSLPFSRLPSPSYRIHTLFPLFLSCPALPRPPTPHFRLLRSSFDWSRRYTGCCVANRSIAIARTGIERNVCLPFRHGDCCTSPTETDPSLSRWSRF